MSQDMEAPFIGARDADLKYPTLVIVAANPDRDSDEENQCKVNLQEVLNDILVDENKVGKTCPHLAALLEEGKEVIELGELRRRFLKDLFLYLVHHGCEVEPFLSIDGDEVFLRVTFGEDTDEYGKRRSFLELQAEETRLRLQTVPELVELLDIKQPLDEIYPMYTQFRHTLQERYEREHKMNIFQTYRFGELPVGRSPEERGKASDASIFRTVDCVRLLGLMIGSRIDLEDCVHHGLLKKYYPVHRQSVLDDLGQSLTLRNFFFTDWLSFELRAEAIRNYWGERVAFYFLWVRFTGLSFICCLPPALLLSLLWYSSVLPEYNELVVYSGTSLVLIGWSAGYVKFWQRHESHYLAKWDCPPPALDELAPPRADYQGEHKAAPFDENIMIRQASWSRQAVGLTLSIIVTVIYLVLVVCTIGSIYYCEAKFHFASRIGHPMTVIIGSILLTVQINISGLIWNRLSQRLVRMENPRSEQDKHDSYIWKVFPFNLVGTYSSFFYTAFIRQWAKFPECYREDCMFELRLSLWAIISAGLMLQVLFMLVPVIRTKYALWKELRDYQQELKRQGAEDFSDARRSAMEAQAKRPEYGTRQLAEDYNRVMIQLGYFVLFGAASPAVLFILILFVFVKVKIDLYKMSHIYRRPLVDSQPRRGLGEWNKMILILAGIGTYTAIGIPLFNVTYIHVHIPNWGWKLVLLLGIKEMVDLIRKCTASIIPDVAGRTKLMLLRRAHVADRMGDRYTNPQDHPHVTWMRKKKIPKMQDISEMHKLDEAHADWELVEKEDDG